ncbi:MAG TPA: tyrosine-protein phosphatase [Kribbellaceae bacterium]
MTTALHLDWPGLLNARDLGGLPVSGGGSIRERALVRSDAHSNLTPDGLAALRSYGVSRVLDLRGPAEIAVKPSPLAGDACYLNLPVQDPSDPEEGSLIELYVGMLERRPDLFATAVAAIAEAPAGTVAVHCAAGKDRTGLVVALALSLAGVPDEAIGADYALTEARLSHRYDELIAEAADEAERAFWQSVRYTPASNITGALEHVRANHGDIASYLTTGGLRPAHHKALTTRLLA